MLSEEYIWKAGNPDSASLLLWCHVPIPTCHLLLGNEITRFGKCGGGVVQDFVFVEQ